LDLGLHLSHGFCGCTIFVADAHRGDRKRFVVRANEKLTAFVELEAVIRANHPGKASTVHLLGCVEVAAPMLCPVT
jgi:hypothetical protein